METLTIELPNKDNTLFDDDDDIGSSTIPDLSLLSEDEGKEVKSNNVWELPLMSYSNCPLSILKGKALKMGQVSRYGNYGAILPME